MSYPDDLRESVDRYLAELTYSPRTETRDLEAAMQYSLLAGGKRIRPVLCLATGRALGVDTESLLPTASALELIHTYSLIHDDLPAMDDDDMRRGRPTSHVAHGEDVAILAGDALFAEAIRLACAQPGSPDLVLASVAEIAAATGVDGMVGGQYVDVVGGGRDPDALRLLHQLKTGRLIAASVGSALALSGEGDSRLAPYKEFAFELGLLFQIVDDILDVTESDQQLGKPSGSDERHGKVTYVSLHGLERARELAAESHRAALASLNEADGEVGSLRQIADFIATRTS